MINTPLLTKVLNHITDHPEEHNQSCWAERGLDTPCGTAFCVAGHAVQFAGHQIDWESDEYADTVVGGGTIERVAAQELGLSGQQANYLFHGGGRQRDLWRLASKITGGEIEIPARFQD